ncbi:hypothetical protein FRB90_009562 [Tulasnella sp. 427]|nr:hypothetical protein FRB90_009562 [Tulasnella sp. 427]
MSGFGGGFTNRTIWDLSPAELDILKTDVSGYLDGLRVVHYGCMGMTTLLVWDIITTWDREAYYVWRSRWSFAKLIFLLNRYLGPATFLCIIISWIWIALSTVTGSTASSILAARLWALYGRDRRLLVVLILGFLACFGPGWILVARPGTKTIAPEELRVFGNVLMYIEGVMIQEGPSGLDWRLSKCYRFHFPHVSGSILVGALVYESGVFTALMYKMYHEQKGTRILEAFYRDGIVYYLVIFSSYAVALGTGFAWDSPLAQSFVTTAFYIGFKSMMCSHIILRLRSYFSYGDPIIDGHIDAVVSDHVDGGGKLGGNSFSSSVVSTIIHFAQMISGSGGTTFDTRSRHLSQGETRDRNDRTTTVEQVAPPFTLTVTSSPPPSIMRRSIDWTTPVPSTDDNLRSGILGDSTLPSRSDSVVGPSTDSSSPWYLRRPRWGGGRHDAPPVIVELEDFSGRDVEAQRRADGPERPPALIPPPSPPVDPGQSGVAHHRYPLAPSEGSGE